MPKRKERSMFTYTATIGRNRTRVTHNLDGTETLTHTPMSDHDWTHFKHAVKYALNESIGWGEPYPETHDGIGTWDGVTEESHKVTAFTATVMADDYSLKLLRDRLRQLAFDYGQQAIALHIGECELVEPAIDPRSHFYPTGHPYISEGVTA